MIYFQTDNGTLYHGDCLEVMASLPDNSVDAVITDPPYGLTFMGKNWDNGVPGEEFWANALIACKPGALRLPKRALNTRRPGISRWNWRIERLSEPGFAGLKD